MRTAAGRSAEQLRRAESTHQPLTHMVQLGHAVVSLPGAGSQEDKKRCSGILAAPHKRSAGPTASAAGAAAATIAMARTQERTQPRHCFAPSAKTPFLRLCLVQPGKRNAPEAAHQNDAPWPPAASSSLTSRPNRVDVALVAAAASRPMGRGRRIRHSCSDCAHA